VAAWGVEGRHKSEALSSIYDSVQAQMLAFYPEEVARGLISAVSDGECRSSFVQREIKGADGRIRPQMSTGFAKATLLDQLASQRALSGRINPGGNYSGPERKQMMEGLTAEYKARFMAIYPAGSRARPSRVRPSAAARDGSAAVAAGVLSDHEARVLRTHVEKVNEEVRAAKLAKSKAQAPAVPVQRGFAPVSTDARDAARVDLNLNILGVLPGSEPEYNDTHLDMHAAILESRGAPQAGHRGTAPNTVMCKVLRSAVEALDLEMRLREGQHLSQAEMVARGMSGADAAGFGYDSHTFLPQPEAHEVPLPGGGTKSVKTFVASMFDTPHLLKNFGGAVQAAHKRKDPCILDAGKLLEVAMNAEGEFALECIFLEGGVGLDKQSEAAKCCIFANPKFWYAVRDANGSRISGPQDSGRVSARDAEERVLTAVETATAGEVLGTFLPGDARFDVRDWDHAAPHSWDPHRYLDGDASDQRFRLAAQRALPRHTLRPFALQHVQPGATLGVFRPGVRWLQAGGAGLGGTAQQGDPQEGAGSRRNTPCAAEQQEGQPPDVRGDRGLDCKEELEQQRPSDGGGAGHGEMGRLGQRGSAPHEAAPCQVEEPSLPLRRPQEGETLGWRVQNTDRL